MTTKLGQFFTRENDRKVVCLTDNAPEWLKEAVQDAHQGDGPNDWIYEECEAAADAIDDGVFDGKYPEDALAEHADGRVEVYTKELFQWQADMCHTSTYSYAEERANELGSDTKDMIKAVQTIQYCAIENIAGTILRAWQESQESDETGEDA